MTLAKVLNGETAAVVKLDLDENRQKRLLSMGLVPGAMVRMMDNSLFGASLIFCRGNKLVLGRELTERIAVSLHKETNL